MKVLQHRDSQRRRIVRLWLLMATLLAVCACGSAPPNARPQPWATREKVQYFFLVGRFSVQHEGKAYTGRISWRHAGQNDDLLISSPFGQALAEVVSDAGGARLTTHSGTQYADSPDALVQTVLGHPLPLSRLLAWLRGLAVDDAEVTRDPHGRPLFWRQGEWRLSYEYADDDPQSLPSRLFASSESAFELRLRIDEWQPLPSEP